ncbi:MAG: DUF935 family protein, partial [Chlorobi bacterium]|nr:DUF935 family protein [Chlorobiota bacterium]
MTVKTDQRLIKELITDSSQFGINTIGTDELLPNPDIVLKKMGKDIDVYSEVRNDANVSAAIGNRQAGTLSFEWDITGGSDSARKLVKEIFEELDLYNITQQILEAPFFGYQPIEVIWDEWRPVRLDSKPHLRFSYDIDRKLRYFPDGDIMGNTLPVPDYKILMPRRMSSWVSPYGKPLLSSIYWLGRFKKDGFKYWITALEKFGIPWISARYNPTKLKMDLDVDDIDEAVSMLIETLDNAVEDAILAVPESVDIKIEKGAANASGAAQEKLVRICDEQITKLILGHSGATDSTSGDKLNNDTTASDVRNHIIAADKHLVESTYNMLIRWICKLNFANTSIDYPKFLLFQDSNINSGRAARDAVLAEKLGVVFTDEYIADTYNIDPKYFKIMVSQLTNSSSDTTGSINAIDNARIKANNKLRTGQLLEENSIYKSLLTLANKSGTDSDEDSEDNIKYKDQTTLAAFIDEVSDAETNDEMMNEFLKPMFDFVAKGTSIEEMLETYDELYDDFNHEKSEEVLIMANFLSNIHGEISVKAENVRDN